MAKAVMSIFLLTAASPPSPVTTGPSTRTAGIGARSATSLVNSSRNLPRLAARGGVSRFFNNCFRQLLPILSVRYDARITKDRSGDS
ncbi:hypothetical protein Pan44_30650 [Caulifigura coniformis]|uniref:Uncharacterized protein n=1 Tax=Caulifigura coniformis TaxID=2527983 RepID=A0A517SFX5_9PLAN|nr:hypothetical protein Pan44_30650 [Caulifigura coniformis]